ncbi:MAG: hypothetical protein AABX98_00330 [Nanoarchaeota archaeon]
MVQAGEQTRGTRSKNKNNARIKTIRDATATAVNSRQKYTAGARGLVRRN